MYKAAFIFFFCFSLTACHNDEHPNSENKTPEATVEAEQPASIIRREQYANITHVSVTDSSRVIEADYVQFLSGEEAIQAARKEGEADMFIEDGDTTYAVPNDHYILNKSKQIRRLILADNASFELVTNPDRDPPVLKNDFKTFLTMYSDNLFILTLENGRIVKVEEVFIP